MEEYVKFACTEGLHMRSNIDDRAEWYYVKSGIYSLKVKRGCLQDIVTFKAVSAAIASS